MKPIVQKWLVLVTASMGLYLMLADRALAQNDQGTDPIVGSWLVHITVNVPPPAPPPTFDAVQSFGEMVLQ